jgi:hypothetical protein
MNEDTSDPFKSLLGKLARVPKAEIDAEEKREGRNKERRKTPRPAAKPGHIVQTPDKTA